MEVSPNLTCAIQLSHGIIKGQTPFVSMGVDKWLNLNRG